MTWIKLNFEDIDNFEWDKVPRFALCEIFKKGEGKIIQVYPHNVLSEDIDELHNLVEYDRQFGKRYFCTGLLGNGFTPKNIIGTCRGSYDDFISVINTICKQAGKVKEK